MLAMAHLRTCTKETPKFVPMPARFRSLSDPESLREFVSKLREGIYIFSRDGRILDANPAFLEMLGIASLAELGPNASDILVDAQVRAHEMSLLDRDGSVREYELTLTRPDGVGPRLWFQKVPEGKVAKNRVHLDVRFATELSGDERMAALETEAERLIAMGATRARRFEPEPPMSKGFLVMQDPEGNEFCLD